MSDKTDNDDDDEDVVVVVLHANGYCVSEKFCEAVRKRVEEVIPAMMPFVTYTLEDLCGEVFWSQLSNGQRRMAGRCMTQLVGRSVLPLCFADSRHEYPKYYRLK